MAEKLKWIDVNEKLLDGVKKVNSLTVPQFIAVLNHIKSSKCPLRELGELQVEIQSSELHFIVQCLTVVYKESQRVVLKPTDLQTQLIDHLQLDKDKAEEFVKIWSGDVRNKFVDLENKSKLTDVSWELNLGVASTYSSNVTNPSARIQLELSDFNSNSKQKAVTLENLDEESLVHLYNTLEVIQKKLDSINA